MEYSQTIIFLCPTCRGEAPFINGVTSAGNCYRCGQFSAECKAMGQAPAQVDTSVDSERAKRIYDYLALYLKTSAPSAIAAITAALGMFAESDEPEYKQLLIDDLLTVVRHLRDQQ